MTDPTGRSFVSYRRSRGDECSRLVAALRERGIPTWRDVDDLNTEPTEDELRRVLRDDRTANVILWITPETATSGMITQVEAPVAVERHSRNDGFFIIPVVAGGLDYADAAQAIGAGGRADIGSWNMVKLESDPANDADIAKVADLALKQRLQAVTCHLPENNPVRIALNTRQTVGHRPGTALTIDWSHRFGGSQNREATATEWQDRLLRALDAVSQAIQQAIPGTRIVAGGLPALPAAVALGYYFMATVGLDIAWEQRMPDGSTQSWSLSAGQEDCGFVSILSAGSVDAEDLAVMVSVNNDVSHTVAATASGPFRASVHVKRDDSAQSVTLSSPGQALDAARKVIAAARNTRQEYGIRGRVHLFAAVPAGLAMLIGQLLNTLGPVQTYEHIQSDVTGHYRPAALLGNV